MRDFNMRKNNFTNQKLLMIGMIASVCIFVGHSNATTYVSKANTGHVSFLAIGSPSFLKIEGKGSGTEGSLDVKDGKATGTFMFELASLDTGIDTRNEHMKEKYLKVSQNPKAILKVEEIKTAKGQLSLGEGLGSGQFKGQLTLNGVTKAIEGVLEGSKHEKGGEKLNAKFSLKLTDYGIEIPSFAGITVADEVKLEVATQLEKGSI
ncbi:MAG: YceI family protein [Proteobacteria bacterium]|nr:YceI family protein [Pseudomonadota bacterium]